MFCDFADSTRGMAGGILRGGASRRFCATLAGFANPACRLLFPLTNIIIIIIIIGLLNI